MNIGQEHIMGVNVGQEQFLAAEPLETGSRNVEKYHVIAAKILRRT